MKKMILALVCLVLLGALPAITQAENQPMSLEDYRVSEWHQVWEHPSYWEDVWSPGWFRYRTWVQTRNPKRNHKYMAMQYWQRRYYINYRIMQHTMFDPYDQVWLTQPDTSWPAENGYVFPATYGRTFLKNITDIWEIRPH